jgi:hypothetical protein
MRDPMVLEQVKGILDMISELAPGHAVELRIPPYAAIQCVEGPKHTRGTPPNVVEMNSETLFSLSKGEIQWSAAVESGAIHASGERSNLEALFASLTNRMHP